MHFSKNPFFSKNYGNARNGGNQNHYAYRNDFSNLFQVVYHTLHGFIPNRFSLKNRSSTIKKISMGKNGDYANFLTTQHFQKTKRPCNNEKCVIKLKKI